MPEIVAKVNNAIFGNSPDPAPTNTTTSNSTTNDPSAPRVTPASNQHNLSSVDRFSDNEQPTSSTTQSDTNDSKSGLAGGLTSYIFGSGNNNDSAVDETPHTTLPYNTDIKKGPVVTYKTTRQLSVTKQVDSVTGEPVPLSAAPDTTVSNKPKLNDEKDLKAKDADFARGHASTASGQGTYQDSFKADDTTSPTSPTGDTGSRTASGHRRASSSSSGKKSGFLGGILGGRSSDKTSADQSPTTTEPTGVAGTNNKSGYTDSTSNQTSNSSNATGNEHSHGTAGAATVGGVTAGVAGASLSDRDRSTDNRNNSIAANQSYDSSYQNTSPQKKTGILGGILGTNKSNSTSGSGTYGSDASNSDSTINDTTTTSNTTNSGTQQAYGTSNKQRQVNDDKYDKNEPQGYTQSSSGSAYDDTTQQQQQQTGGQKKPGIIGALIGKKSNNQYSNDTASTNTDSLGSGNGNANSNASGTRRTTGAANPNENTSSSGYNSTPTSTGTTNSTTNPATKSEENTHTTRNTAGGAALGGVAGAAGVAGLSSSGTKSGTGSKTGDSTKTTTNTGNQTSYASTGTIGGDPVSSHNAATNIADSKTSSSNPLKKSIKKVFGKKTGSGAESAENYAAALDQSSETATSGAKAAYNNSSTTTKGANTGPHSSTETGVGKGAAVGAGAAAAGALGASGAHSTSNKDEHSRKTPAYGDVYNAKASKTKQTDDPSVLAGKGSSKAGSAGVGNDHSTSANTGTGASESQPSRDKHTPGTKQKEDSQKSSGNGNNSSGTEFSGASDQIDSKVSDAEYSAASSAGPIAMAGAGLGYVYSKITGESTAGAGLNTAENQASSKASSNLKDEKSSLGNNVSSKANTNSVFGGGSTQSSEESPGLVQTVKETVSNVYDSAYDTAKPVIEKVAGPTTTSGGATNSASGA